MRALQIHGAKDLRLVELEPPPLSAGEVRVAVGTGGICGSDLSYFFMGKVGDFALAEPLILGHEIAGRIVEIGEGVDGLTVGASVAVDPSCPCRRCIHCLAGRSNLCSDMHFYGSAARKPHVQGAFSDLVVAHADQCHVVPESMPPSVAAAAEPLAVALHAVGRAGCLLGKRVIIGGAGPIGLLIALAARQAGAAEISIFDIASKPLAVAKAIGVDRTLKLGEGIDPLKPFEADKGVFDIAFEATGAAAALGILPRVTHAGGTIVQVGMLQLGEVGLAVNLLMSKEIDYRGSFRFHDEYAMAIDFLITGKVDVTPLITDSYAIDDASAAFTAAADRERSIKVQLTF